MEKSIFENFVLLEKLIEYTGHQIQSGDYDEAISLVQLCGDFASRNHSGIFTSNRIEYSLQKLGDAVPSLQDITREDVEAAHVIKNHVVHIMTEAHPVGGSTRLVWRWIQNDHAQVHSVILTGQGIARIPILLQNAVTDSGGSIHLVDKTKRTKMQSAAHIRFLVKQASLIVLHIHPHDPLALVALSHWKMRPLTLFMNHADHLFWLGSTIADHYLAFRKSGYDICVNRRGIATDKCSVLPIPIKSVSAQLSKGEAKEKLGLPENSILCITMGFSYKFFTSGKSPHFVDAILPVFKQQKTAHLIAIGPAHAGEWLSGDEQTNGRIQAIGECVDTDIYLKAADVFLMPMPIHSSTAALEAGSYGLGILVYTDPLLSDTVFSADSIGLRQSILNTTSIQAYRENLSRLICDQTFRMSTGNKTQHIIQKYHGESAWLSTLKSIIQKTEQSPTICNDSMGDDFLCQAEDEQLIEIKRGILSRPAIILIRYCASFSLSSKLYIWWKYSQPLKTFNLKYSFIEFILLFLSQATILKLRAAFEHQTIFRRLFLK